jgi:hypothetical protein
VCIVVSEASLGLPDLFSLPSGSSFLPWAEPADAMANFIVIIIVLCATYTEGLQRIPRFANGFRQFLGFVLQNASMNGIVDPLSHPSVLQCVNKFFPDASAPLYQDLVGVGREKKVLEFASNFLFVTHPTMPPVLACLLDIYPPIFAKDALATFAAPFAMTATTLVGHNRGALHLLRTLRRTYPACINTTETVVEAATMHSAGTTAVFRTDLPRMDVSIFHKAFDARTWLFYGDTHSVLKPSESALFIEYLTVAVRDLMQELKGVHGLTNVQKKELFAALTEAEYHISHRAVTPRGSSEVLGRTLRTKDMRVVTDVVSLLIIDALIPPLLSSPNSSPRHCLLDSIMPAILLRDDNGRSSLFMAAVYGNASTNLLMDRVGVWLEFPPCFHHKERFEAALTERDMFGFTPADVSEAHRAYDNTARNSKKGESQPDLSPPIVSTGGWIEPRALSPLAEQALAAHYARGYSATRCDIDVVDGRQPLPILQKAFFDHFILSKPVIFRGFASDRPIQQSFTFEQLVSQFGDVVLDTGDIPYANIFEGSGHGTQTLAEYVLGVLYCNAKTGQFEAEGVSDVFRRVKVTSEILSDGGKQSTLCKAFVEFGSRNYAFTKLDSGMGGSTPALMKLLSDFPLLDLRLPAIPNASSAWANEAPTPDEQGHMNSSHRACIGASSTALDAQSSSEKTSSVLYGGDGTPRAPAKTQTLVMAYPSFPNPQIYVGVAGSGAPVHHHNNAVNVLLHGKKNWFLFPAHRAEYSTVPIVHYILHELPYVSDSAIPLECVQEAGDAIYIPRHWGHAVLNLQSVTGYAIEFPTRWRY